MSAVKVIIWLGGLQKYYNPNKMILHTLLSSRLLTVYSLQDW